MVVADAHAHRREPRSPPLDPEYGPVGAVAHQGVGRHTQGIRQFVDDDACI